MIFFKNFSYQYFIKLIKILIPRQVISLISRLYGFFFQNVKSQSGVIFDPENNFEGNNSLQSNTRVYSSKVGKYTYIASNSLISKTKIGRYTSIGNWVSTGIGRHPTNFVSTHPLFHSSLAAKSLGFDTFNHIGEKFETHKEISSGFYVEIGSDVWIGDRVIIMDGIKIGDGAIVGAGSIVNKDVQPYQIVAGIPARQLKYRFSKDKIDDLLNLRWWNKGEDWIKKNSDSFSNINDFNFKV